MCGIVGVLGQLEAAPRILDALKRLEYRGYDSAGLTTLQNGAPIRRRARRTTTWCVRSRLAIRVTTVPTASRRCGC